MKLYSQRLACTLVPYQSTDDGTQSLTLEFAQRLSGGAGQYDWQNKVCISIRSVDVWTWLACMVYGRPGHWYNGKTGYSLLFNLDKQNLPNNSLLTGQYQVGVRHSSQQSNIWWLPVREGDCFRLQSFVLGLVAQNAHLSPGEVMSMLAVNRPVLA